MDLGNWLRNQGLERFETAFRDNDIDATVLPHLTEDHLRELGLPMGARIKLLAAIAALPKEVARPSTAVVSVESTADVAERRQITVLFSDLVGSTALSTRMDPEDLRKLISAYQKCVTETVRRFGGFVAKYMGDGVLIYFGYPAAHEDDAERAVRAGLELVAAVAKLKMDTPCRRASASLRAWWWSAISSAPDRRRSEGLSARRRTLPPGCKGLPSRTWSLWPMPQEGSLAVCSTYGILETTSSRVSRVLYVLGRRFARQLSKVASRHFIATT